MMLVSCVVDQNGLVDLHLVRADDLAVVQVLLALQA